MAEQVTAFIASFRTHLFLNQEKQHWALLCAWTKYYDSMHILHILMMMESKYTVASWLYMFVIVINCSVAVKKCPPILFPFPGNVTCVDTPEPFSFGSCCNFTCHEGYALMGETTMSCLASGKWSGSTPTCAGLCFKLFHKHGRKLIVACTLLWCVSFPVVQCSRLEAPHNASIRCDNPLGEHSYSSSCIVRCDEGFDLIGTNTIECSSRGQWSSALPVCQGITTQETVRTLFCSGCFLSLDYVRPAVTLV